MGHGILKWLKKKYPQNYIIKKPSIGSLIFLIFCVVFVILYKPLGLGPSRFFGFKITMLVYCAILTVALIGIVKSLKSIRFFSDFKEWTLFKELVSIFIILLLLGTVLYFSGFLLQEPGSRWNFSTFADSTLKAFGICIGPLLFFTLINYKHLIVNEIVQDFVPDNNSTLTTKNEELIHIISQLKKEELSFYPNQLIYAESDGNYVVFYLEIDNQLKKRIVRNSITNIEQQLLMFPFIIRTHRAFIINLNRLKTKKGNTLGYQLLLTGTDAEIPVSRQKTRDFDRLLKQKN